MLVEPSQCHYKKGDIVKVIEGHFTGVVGRVARVAGQQRVVVEIDGLCTVSLLIFRVRFWKKYNGLCFI